MSAEAGLIYSHFRKHFPDPKEGDLRIWWIPQIPGKTFEWPVTDLEMAGSVLDMLAGYDDFQFAERVKGDYCNMGGLLIFRNGDWESTRTHRKPAPIWSQSHFWVGTRTRLRPMAVTRV